MRYSTILAVFFSLHFLWSQTTQNFNENFRTDSGIYGVVYYSTKPITFSTPYILVQQDRIVVNGVNSVEGSFSDNMLFEYGVSFPFDCNNCKFYASGKVSMLVNGSLNRDYGTFVSGGAISRSNDGQGNTNQKIKFNSNAIKRHNNAVNEGFGSAWEENGRVESISIRGVGGGELGKITNAISKYKAEEDMKAKVDQILSTINKNDDSEQILRINLRKYSEIAIIDNDVKYSNKIKEIRERIAEISAESNQANQQKKLIKEANADDITNSSQQTSSVSQSRQKEKIIKKRFDYTTMEFNQLSQEEQKASYAKQEEYDNAGKSKIDENLKATADKQLYSGNYLQAANTYSESGDHTSAFAALGAGVLSDIFASKPSKPKTAKELRQERLDREKWRAIEKRRNQLYYEFYNNKVTGEYNSGVAPKRNREGWYGYVDKNNNWVIEAKYLHASTFKEGNATVMTKMGKTVLINKNGGKL